MKQKLLTAMVAMACITSVSYAQTREVSGTVTSSDGTPISGASISVVGTNTATQTDGSGRFKISVSPGATLNVSYIGYESQRVAIGNSTTLTITLSGGDQALDEVVVTALGIQRSSKSLAYSTSKVDPDQLLQNSEPDLLKSMQGKVAGVDIRTSQGTPGAATRFQVRGNSSFFGNNQPLIIVDGVPYDNSMVETSSMTSGGSAYSSGISNLDPNDIETFNVLKGSAAAALYGSRASNGVVIITTKSGSTKLDQPTTVTMRNSLSFENIANLPEYQNLYGAGSQFNYSSSNGSWGAAFSSRDSIPTWGPYLEAYPELFGRNVPYRPYENNVRDLFNTGKVWENSINFTGGSAKSGFNVTLSQMDHKGYVPNSSFKRYNLSSGGNLKVSERMNVRGSLSYSNSNQIGGYFGENQVDGAASSFARSLFLARNWDGSLPWEDKSGNNLNWLGASQFDHPTWSAYNNYATTLENRIVGSFATDFEVNDWLKLDYSLGANLSFMNRKEIYEISSRAYEGFGGLVVDGRNHKELESTVRSIFTPKISDDITFTGNLGFNYNQRIITRIQDEGKRFIARGTHTLINTEQKLFNIDLINKRRIMGLFAEGVFGYKNYLYLTLTGRNDWSSTLPKESRSYFYPGVSTAFVFTDVWDVNRDILSYGKLRAAWAKVGRDTDPYSLITTYVIENNFLGKPTGHIDYTNYSNALTPEFSNEIELGTELSFFKSRINLDFTWYNKTSTDLLAEIALPASSGFDYYFTNFGKISNKGVEITLGLKPLSPDSDFKWNLSAAFTKNKNMVEELIDGTPRIELRAMLSGTISTYLEPGMPFGYLRGTKVYRDDEGNVLINPQNGAMIDDPTQEYYIGNPNPDFKLGINNILAYKNFTFSALFDWTKGGDMYSVTNSSLLGRGVTRDTEGREFNAIIPGVYGDPTTGLPLLDANGSKMWNQTRITVNDLYFSPDPNGVGSSFAINTASEWNVYDATVYRLREVSLGYDLPKNLFSNGFIKGINLSVTGRNLWFFAPNFPKYSNFDPEVSSYGSSSSQGVELSAAPTTRRYGFNLVARF